MKPAMRCAVYARFSTDKQDVVSIDTQLMMCRREIAREGWTEIACFTDPAESAATLHRPGMQALLAAVAAGDVDIVYADAMDRLSRSQADIATVYERLRFRGILLATRKEGVVTPLHIGMMGTINAEQLSATSEKTRDALVRRHTMGRNPGGVAYGYDKRIAHDANGERIRGLQQIVPHEAVIVVRILEEYAAGRSPIAITRQLNLEGVPPPRSQRRDARFPAKPPAWAPNTLTGNAARGTGILNNILYTGYRPYLKQTFRKNPDTGKRHGFLIADGERAELVEVPDLRIVTGELWSRVKARQSFLAQGPKLTPLPFHDRQRPRYLLTGKMTCGECGASYAKSGKSRFGCQGAAKKGPTWCGNRLTIRQDELDARVLAGVQNEMLRPEVFAMFLEEYRREIGRLQTLVNEAAPARESELAEADAQIDTMKAAILKGVDPSLFVEELNRLAKRRQMLVSKTISVAGTEACPLLHPDISTLYREKVASLTSAFEDEGLQVQAFERLRSLIEGVALTPQEGALSIQLRGDLASMLELCACAEMQKASADVSEEALQIKMVAGTGFEPVTFRL